MAKFAKSRDDDRLGNAAMPGIAKTFPIRRRNASVIASTWLVKSELLSAEGLMIDGYLECAMAHHQQHLTVSENAHVEANIHASTVVVFGHLIGDIFSEGKVSLASSSDVQGDICCACLFIEEGARFMGRVEMGKCAAPADLEYS